MMMKVKIFQEKDKGGGRGPDRKGAACVQETKNG